ncbi:NAD-dependent epimerase/dehydratase family protein [Paenibacillus sp. strain BS8-2]
MMNILITGVTGFIGERLVKRLAGQHTIIGMSRGAFHGDAISIRGHFERFEDLRLLDAYAIDAVIHLAAVTGGCSEEDGLAVNVQGTRRLYRYLLDRGCKRFITASSIALAGGLDNDFVPLKLPIPDDHPCLATDAYGWSKSMLEQLTCYLHRKTPDADFVNLRFGAVVPEDWEPPFLDASSKVRIPFILLGRVYVDDVIEGIASVLDAPAKARASSYNLIGPDISSNIPTGEILKSLLSDRGAELDLSYYTLPGNEYKPLYGMDRMKSDFGFVSVRSTRIVEV